MHAASKAALASDLNDERNGLPVQLPAETLPQHFNLETVRMPSYEHFERLMPKGPLSHKLDFADHLGTASLCRSNIFMGIGNCCIGNLGRHEESLEVDR